MKIVKSIWVLLFLLSFGSLWMGVVFNAEDFVRWGAAGAIVLLIISMGYNLLAIIWK